MVVQKKKWRLQWRTFKKKIDGKCLNLSLVAKEPILSQWFNNELVSSVQDDLVHLNLAYLAHLILAHLVHLILAHLVHLILTHLAHLILAHLAMKQLHVCSLHPPAVFSSPACSVIVIV